MIANLEMSGTATRTLKPVDYRDLQKQLQLLRQQLAWLEQMVQLHAPGQGLSVAQIQVVVALDFKLPLAVMTFGKRGPEHECWARSVAMYLTRELTDLSLTEIGKEFGSRDHSTIGYAVERVKERMEVEPRTKREVQGIMNFLLNNAGKTAGAARH